MTLGNRWHRLRNVSGLGNAGTRAVRRSAEQGHSLPNMRPIRLEGVSYSIQRGLVFQGGATSRSYALSHPPGTVRPMPRRRPKDEPLRSTTGLALTRDVSFKFALDPTSEQASQLFAHAGAARFAFNHHIARVRTNLDQRTSERSYGVTDSDLTPSLSWSKFACINEFNAWKNGQLPSSPSNDDGTAGLSWRGEVSADVFEVASVNAAQALANFSESRKGTRKGKRGYPFECPGLQGF